MTQYWAKMHMKSDSAAESVRPAKSQGPAGTYWESLVKPPFGGAFARQRPILTAPRSSFQRKEPAVTGFTFVSQMLHDVLPTPPSSGRGCRRRRRRIAASVLSNLFSALRAAPSCEKLTAESRQPTAALTVPLSHCPTVPLSHCLTNTLSHQPTKKELIRALFFLPLFSS